MALFKYKLQFLYYRMGNAHFSESHYKSQLDGQVKDQGLKAEKILWEGIVLKLPTKVDFTETIEG